MFNENNMIKEREKLKSWRNNLMFIWFILIGIIGTYLYCVGNVNRSRDENPNNNSNDTSTLNFLDYIQLWSIQQFE